mgnify:CR=1 FL=1|tara:strand:- start:1755 stop:2129 length:375 start_codon:yes stop_codon:yes gene_type:complete
MAQSKIKTPFDILKNVSRDNRDSLFNEKSDINVQGVEVADLGPTIGTEPNLPTTSAYGMPSGEMDTVGTSLWSQGPTFEDWIAGQPGGGNIDPNNPQGGDYWLEEYINFMYSNYGDPNTPVGGM